jgi:hypothetical protein
MSVEAAIILAIVILVVTFVVVVVVAVSRQQKAKEEEMQRAASARGWNFESKTEGGYRVHRWTGATEGVSWTAESLTYRGSSKNNQKRRHISRWHGAWNPGISGAIVAIGLPKGKEDLGRTIAAGDGFFAKLAQKAAGFALDKAIDAYFGDAPGKEVDAGAMHRIEAKTPGFVVMAANKDEGARVLHQGLEQALVTAASDSSSVLSEEKRPWILMRPHAVSLARTEPFRDVNEIEAFIRAGVGLTRTSKFGRPFS